MVETSEEIQQQRRRSFAKILQDLRAALKLSQPEIADRIGVTRNAYQNWEGSKSNPVSSIDPHQLTGEKLEAIAKLRGQTIDELFRDIRQGDESAPKPDAASIEISIGVIEVELAKIRELAEIKGANMCRCAIAALIRQEFLDKGLNPEERDHFQEFLNAGSYTEPAAIERVRAIVFGELRPDYRDLPRLALALTSFTGRDFTQADLVRINNTPIPGTEQGQEHVGCLGN